MFGSDIILHRKERILWPVFASVSYTIILEEEGEVDRGEVGETQRKHTKDWEIFPHFSPDLTHKLCAKGILGGRYFGVLWGEMCTRIGFEKDGSHQLTDYSPRFWENERYAYNNNESNTGSTKMTRFALWSKSYKFKLDFDQRTDMKKKTHTQQQT